VEAGTPARFRTNRFIPNRARSFSNSHVAAGVVICMLPALYSNVLLVDHPQVQTIMTRTDVFLKEFRVKGGCLVAGGAIIPGCQRP
jgi:hypothetical protein